MSTENFFHVQTMMTGIYRMLIPVIKDILPYKRTKSPDKNFILKSSKYIHSYYGSYN